MSSVDLGKSDDTAAWIIPADALPHDIAPGSGVESPWRTSEASELPMAAAMCDVVLEPIPPVESLQVRFGWSAFGPFVYQSVRLYADPAQAPRVVARIKVALRTCTSIHYEAHGSTPATDLAVTPVGIVGLPSVAVAWKTTPMGHGTRVIVAPTFVLIPHGEALIQFEFVDVTGRVDAGPILTAAVRALEGLRRGD